MLQDYKISRILQTIPRPHKEMWDSYLYKTVSQQHNVFT